MAIDSAEKRKSAAGTSFGYAGLLPGVTPNSSKGQEWRQQAAWSYSGIFVEFITIVGPMWAAGQSYTPGFKQGDSYIPGFYIGQTYIPGFQEGQN